MYKICKTEQSVRRQRELEKGLLKAMEQRNFDEISISELCESMGVPRKSFYRYFASKEGAFYALIDHTLMEYESFERDAYTRSKRTLRKDLERFYRFWQHNSQLISALERSGLAGVLVQRAVDYALAEFVFPGRFIPGESREVQNQVVTFSVCGLLAMMFQWHHGGYQTSVRELAEMAERLLTRPLFTEAGRQL